MNTKIKVKDLALNKGQIEGLPANPRQWTKEDVKQLAKSIQETPELLEARPLIAIPHGNQYVVLGGNLRLEALKSLKWDEAPVFLLPGDTPIDKQKEIVIKDNGSFGQWDADILANEWDVPLEDWGVPDWVTGGAAPAEPKKTGEINLSSLGDTIELKIALAADEYSFVKSALSEAGETDREGLLNICGYGEE